MSGISPPSFKGRFVFTVLGFCLIAVQTVYGQVTVDISSHLDDQLISIFTPGAIVPAQKLVLVESDTTGPVTDTHFGLNGVISGNDWLGGSDGNLGFQVADDDNDDNTNSYVTILDLVKGGVSPDTITEMTLRAFAFTTGASGYQTGTISLTAITGFDASQIAIDSVPISVEVRDSTIQDRDLNGIPDSSVLSSVTSSRFNPFEYLFRPDSNGQPDYWVERLAVSIEDFDPPNGFTFHSKQFIIDFQIYDVRILVPNFTWFKTNRASDPDIATATNIVMIVRAEQDPDFILDNNTTNRFDDPLFTGSFSEDPETGESLSFGVSDPPAEFTAQFGTEFVTPSIYFSVSLIVEKSPGVWSDLRLGASAPMQIQVSSIGLEGKTNLHLYRYPITTIQSTANSSSIFSMGKGDPWVELNVSDLESNGVSSSFTFDETTRGALFAAALGFTTDGFDQPVEDEGGGGSGGCFIATAVYGTPLAHEIDSLRAFRDGYLLDTAVGSAFVDGYYRLSPRAADFIAEHGALRMVVRAALAPIVVLTQGFLATPRLVIGLMMTLIVLCFLRRRAVWGR